MPLPALPPAASALARRTCTSAAAGVLVGGAAACFEPLLSPPQYATVQVTTSTPDGAPVPEVRLTLYTGQRPIEYAVSDAEGMYRFERVPPGNYGVVAQFPDEFRDLTEAPYLVRDALTVRRGDAVVVAMQQARCVGSITLTVGDSSGRRAVGIPASLYTSEGPVQQGVTDATGTTRFLELRCREYGVALGPSATCTIGAGRGSSFADGIAVRRARPDASVALTVARCG